MSENEIEEVENIKKRPKWVWAITIWYVFSFLSTGYSFYAIYNGLVPLTEAQQEYFSNLNFIDWGISIISALLAISAAVTLFMLKKITIKLWATVVSFGVIAQLYSVVSSNYLESIGAGGLVGAIFGLAIMLSIYFYAKRLDTRGYLS